MRWLRRRRCAKQGHQALYDVEERTLSCRRCDSLVDLAEVLSLV